MEMTKKKYKNVDNDNRGSARSVFGKSEATMIATMKFITTTANAL